MGKWLVCLKSSKDSSVTGAGGTGMRSGDREVQVGSRKEGQITGRLGVKTPAQG